MRLNIAIDEMLPARVERVWHALTDAQMLGRWLMVSDNFEARVGTRFTLRSEELPGDACFVECEVLELSPPHRMVWSWSSTEGGAPTRLVIELEAHGQATRLTLRHTGETDEEEAARTTAGWHDKLGQLAAALTELGTPRPLTNPRLQRR
jgi:uncharacterized protein YndB with AHSA1/START domain